MRKLLWIPFCFAVLATPAHAQQLARAEVTAHIRIPDFLSMRVGDSTDLSKSSRRVTVYVTANRVWQLSVAPTCGTSCSALRWRVLSAGVTSTATRVVGRNGNDIPVVIEYEWAEGTTPPSPSELEYLLIAG
ncbi:MAG: hypothetical protein ACT4O1_02210 [Gemmatimonadota bacterium]